MTATGRIGAAHPDVRVLVLTTYDTDAGIVRAVTAGATGHLLRDAPLPQPAEAPTARELEVPGWRGG